MAEIEGVRQWLDRAAEFLSAQLRWLGGQIVPGAVPHVVIPARPARIDNTDPGRYRFEAVANLSWRDDPTAAHRAAHTLTAAGWTVALQRDPHYPTVVTVTATREGYRLQVRTEEGYDGIVLLGETPGIALYEEATPPAPAPAVTSGTAHPGAVLCYECDRLGACPTCQGRGWTRGGPSGRHRCRGCLGSRRCPICEGAGELPLEDLSDADRAHYPRIP